MSRFEIFKSNMLFVLFFFSMAFFIGCQQKDDVEGDDPVSEDTTLYDAAGDTLEAPADTSVQTDTLPNLVGVWTGTLAGRSTTLRITDQSGNEFSGSISIAYREAVNQDVKGKLDFENLSFTMSDQLHSRYRGKYSGKISQDFKTLSGTFTQDIDKETGNFNLTMK
jgi:hypothetical protein